VTTTESIRFECCGCDQDVTAAVLKAFAERRWGVESVLAPEDADSDGPVIVTCSNGHTCEYVMRATAS
jgi:hypothetical protein